MPNLRGPDERRKRLFANTVMSIVLYVAPVWEDTLTRSKRQPALHRLQRTIAQRVISAYRTVSSNAALLLARLPPVKLVAGMRKKIYDQIKMRREDGSFLPETRKEIKEPELQKMYDEWREQLERPNSPGGLTLMAIVPRLEVWMARKSGSMSFHLTQIMTGHGCFPKILCRIGKKTNTTCDFYGCDMDDPNHTLRVCTAWEPQRILLARKLDLPQGFTLGDIVEAVATSLDCWRAFSAFAEEVIREKEEEERRRERMRLSPPYTEDDGVD
ncbi:reverse transcriptase [Lasius niger]|uniref:Reverse transcriptase n=1 Tax=Lasius niger TaxID=67767 RepID=A0A0J7K4I2_LASNI|nr:reverse transcriptase [Lasius niger]